MLNMAAITTETLACMQAARREVATNLKSHYKPDFHLLICNSLKFLALVTQQDLEVQDDLSESDSSKRKVVSMRQKLS